ncbi:MAG TPA: glycosyltransferase N-terminal domain-containing protein [Longimicrobiales bacterium]|nr:glycosyltransferase N-terminal domain-containing protein [Longimicrobiales bacterium]
MFAAALYRSAQRLLRAAAPSLGRGTSKAARGIAGRSASLQAMAAWARSERDRARPGAWLHAPSVGEGFQARAVLEALQRRRPALQAVFTHFSPSAEGLAARMGAAWAGYLPWDLPEEMGPALDAAAPGVVAFTKTEVWPVLVEEAARRRIPVALVGGSVRPGARRSRWPGRTLMRPTWSRLSLACAIGEDDAEGLRSLGVPAEMVRVTGDPGVDSAAERARGADPASPWLAPFHAERRPTVVAGSTWPSDLRVLLPALDAARRREPGLRAVLAPHEPHPEVVRELLADLSQRGWRSASLADVEARGAAAVDAVVVDRVGVLAHLYTVADVAYVGGGFHAAGLHSVLEPAAAGVPVLFGPGRGNARAAGDLLAAGAARDVRDGTSMAEALESWFGDAAARGHAAARAFGYIHAHLGAADRTAALLDEVLPPG